MLKIVRVFFSFVFFCLAVVSNARAQSSENPEAHFSFTMSATSPGCAKVSYISTFGSFPGVNNGVVTSVRFFHSDLSPLSVTDASPFEETSLTTDEQGSVAVTPNEFCGLKSGRTFFKYGLYDTNNQLLEFMDPANYDQYGNSVVIQ